MTQLPSPPMGRLLAALAAVIVLAGCAPTPARHDDSTTTTSSRRPSATAMPGWGSATPRPQSPSATVPSLTEDELKDASYIAALIQEGVPVDSREDAISHGVTVCVYLDQSGTNIAGAIIGLVEEYGYSDEDAGYLAGTAVSVYCPEHTP